MLTYHLKVKVENHDFNYFSILPSENHDFSRFLWILKKKYWCGAMTPPENRVISMFAGLLANHDRAHSLGEI
jgi:hypothetical protein